MKRILSIFMPLCLMFSLAVPAMAETPETMEDELAVVTSLVKQTLDVDDNYTDFSGNYNDGLRPGWYLNWADGDRELSVTCDPDGLITDAYRWENSGAQNDFYGFDAAFPAVGEDEARARAESWLSRLMGENETARIDGFTVTLAKTGGYRFYGRVLKNGLESPVTFTIRVGASGLEGYSRGDSYKDYVGGVPDPTPAVRQAEAVGLLRDSLAVELYYVTDAGGEARLRYVPVGPYMVVDAQSGEAIDMDALYASFGSSRNDAEAPAAEMSMAAEDSGAGRGLTQVELGSIGNYKDALSQEALDAALRALPEIGLEDFQLVRCSYALDSETGQIEAALRYTAEMTENRLFGYSRAAFEDYMAWGDRPTVTKYVTMDAKSGALIDLYTSYPFWEDGRGTIVDYVEDPYARFLQAAAPEMFAASALCALAGQIQGEGETFARVHEGYFFPENYLYVALNPGTGTVDEFRYQWDEDVRFAASEGLVDEPDAIAAYADALDVTLGYAAWPEAIDWDDPALYRYADWGYTFLESLRLAYYYGGTAAVAGVDALTGAALREDPGGGFDYDDLAGEGRREAIEALGAVSIGFEGGSFRPGDILVMRDAAVLLLQAAGYDVRGWDDESLRSEAGRIGFIRPEDWEPERAVTRMELIRMILGPSRYGAAARDLAGVWAPGFADVTADDEGYAAVGKALGMASGGRLAPETVCTRADGAELLFRFMSR